MDAILEQYLKDDLFDELRGMLCSATEWRAYKEGVEEKKLVPDPVCRRHLQVDAMNATFLHARCLYEFFNLPNPRSVRMSWRDFQLSEALKSDLYLHDPQQPQDLVIPLHGRVMHLNKKREGYDE